MSPLLLLLIALQASPPASGTEAAAAPPSMVAAPIALAIAGWDADGDGRTSRTEMTAGVARSFAAADSGHHGKLRLLDYADWCLRWLGDRTARPTPFELDTDGDDQVSLAELQTAFAAAFDRLDADRDGFVTHAELLTVRAGGRDEGRDGGRRPRR